MRGKAASLASIGACGKEARKPRAWWQKMANEIWASVEEEWMRKRSGILSSGKEGVHQISQLYVGRQFWDHVPLERKPGANAKISY